MKHPAPPSDLASRLPRLRALQAGTVLHRFHNAALGPVFFDRGTTSRLNAPDGRFGVLYTALSAAGAFAETFLRTPGATLLDPDLVAQKACAALALQREVRLIELHGPGAAVIGATAELCHAAPPYDLPQAWSSALHAHPVQADGLAYRARHNDDEICVALFDRAQDAITIARRERNLDADWFYELAERYGLGLAP